MMKTIMVLVVVSLRLGQETLSASCLTCLKNIIGLVLLILFNRHVKINARNLGKSHSLFTRLSPVLNRLIMTRFQSESGIIGRRGGTRTRNPRFWRPVLYQLSYTPVSPFYITIITSFREKPHIPAITRNPCHQRLLANENISYPSLNAVASSNVPP